MEAEISLGIGIGLDAFRTAGETWTGATDLVAVTRQGHFTDGALPWEALAFSAGEVRAAA